MISVRLQVQEVCAVFDIKEYFKEYNHKPEQSSVNRYCISFDVEVNKELCPDCEYIQLKDMKYEI